MIVQFADGIRMQMDVTPGNISRMFGRRRRALRTAVMAKLMELDLPVSRIEFRCNMSPAILLEVHVPLETSLERLQSIRREVIERLEALIAEWSDAPEAVA